MPRHDIRAARILLALGTLWLALQPALTFAEESRAWRHGILVGVGAGAGPGDTNTPNFGRRGVTGFVADVRAGYGVSPSWDLGLQRTMWAKGALSHDRRLLVVNAVSLTWFPSERDFFVRGGPGLAQIIHSYDVGDRDQISDSKSGLGVLLAVGYEWIGFRDVSTTKRQPIKAISWGPEINVGYGRAGGARMYFASALLGMRGYF